MSFKWVAIALQAINFISSFFRRKSRLDKLEKEFEQLKTEIDSIKLQINSNNIQGSTQCQKNKESKN